MLENTEHDPALKDGSSKENGPDQPKDSHSGKRAFAYVMAIAAAVLAATTAVLVGEEAERALRKSIAGLTGSIDMEAAIRRTTEARAGESGNPNVTQAERQMIYVSYLSENGNPDEAFERYERLKIEFPGEYWQLEQPHRLALALAHEKQPDKAVRIFEDLLSMPCNPKHHMHYAHFLAYTSNDTYWNPTRALQIAEDAIGHIDIDVQNMSVTLQYLDILAMNGRFNLVVEKATKMLEREDLFNTDRDALKITIKLAKAGSQRPRVDI